MCVVVFPWVCGDSLRLWLKLSESRAIAAPPGEDNDAHLSAQTRTLRIRQSRKSLRLCLARLRVRWIDPIAEAPELPDHSRRSLLPRLFGDRGAAFFVTNPLMQDQPDQPTLSMGNGSDRLVVSQAWDRAAINNLEDASFGPGSGVGRLVEKAPHVAVALRGPMAVVHACTLLIARASAHPRGETFRGGKGFCRGTDFSNDLLR